MSKRPNGTYATWGVHRVNRHGKPAGGYIPCLFGTRADARDNCDDDEIVVLVEYRVVKVEPPKRKGKAA